MLLCTFSSFGCVNEPLESIRCRNCSLSFTIITLASLERLSLLQRFELSGRALDHWTYLPKSRKKSNHEDAVPYTFVLCIILHNQYTHSQKIAEYWTRSVYSLQDKQVQAFNVHGHYYPIAWQYWFVLLPFLSLRRPRHLPTSYFEIEIGNHEAACTIATVISIILYFTRMPLSTWP